MNKTDQGFESCYGSYYCYCIRLLIILKGESNIEYWRNPKVFIDLFDKYKICEVNDLFGGKILKMYSSEKYYMYNDFKRNLVNINSLAREANVSFPPRVMEWLEVYDKMPQIYTPITLK